MPPTPGAQPVYLDSATAIFASTWCTKSGIADAVGHERERERVTVLRPAVAGQVRDVVEGPGLAAAVALGARAVHLVLERAGLSATASELTNVELVAIAWSRVTTCCGEVES